jgi:anti-anti-sigma regulatory factor
MTIELHLTTKGESTCLALLGEFELQGVEELQERLEQLEDEARPVIDLRGLVVVDRSFEERGLVGGSRPAAGPFDSGA